ncbi:MAG TPA: DUF11 domain-containing protein [Thermoanaerobaculia bacterium]|nr:DUF11 domain-containing protein [Thermoanaerobaculia bacterium]
MLASLLVAAITLTLPPHAPGEHVVVRGAADRDDTLVIELPVAAKSIDYDGGAGGFDVLELRGGSACMQRVTQLTPHDGIIEIDGLTIRYFNLEPITDTGAAASYVISGTPGFDDVTVTDGPGGTTTVSSPSFESVTFANKTNVVFDGLGGGDHVIFQNPAPATGLVSFIVENVNRVIGPQVIRYPSFGVSATGEIELATVTFHDVDNVELSSSGGDIRFGDSDTVTIGNVSPTLPGVSAGGSVFISAVSGITVDAAATVTGDLLATGAPVRLFSSFGGIVVNGTVTTGAGGGDISIVPFSFFQPGIINGSVISQSGDVSIEASALQINPTATVSAPLGRVHIFSTRPDFDLGSTGDASGTGIELSQAEIDRITTPELELESIGRNLVTQPIAFGGHLILSSPDGPTATGSGSLTAPTLSFESGMSHTWTITPASVQVQFGAPVPYSATTLNVITSTASRFSGPTASDDTFVVTPSAATTINVDGNLHTTGDVLDFELAGVIAPVLTATLGPNGYSGSLTSANRQPVNFSDIERIIDAPVDIAVTKTDNATNVVAGTPVTYTIVVSNSAPIAVAGVNVADAFPPALTGVTWTCAPSAGSSCAGAGSGNLNQNVTLAANGSVTFTVTGTLAPAATGTLANSVNVTTPAGFVETNPANNSATDTSTITAAADLIVTKNSAAGTTLPDRDVTYTITLRNAGPSDAQNVALTDVLPASTRFVSLTAAPGYTCTTPPAGGTGTVTCTRAVLPPSATADTFTLVVHVDGTTAGGTAIVNTVSATTTTPDPVPGNDAATATTTVIVQSDLIVTKSGPSGTTFAGGELTYTITLRNAGPSDAQSVTLTDVIPASTTFVSFTAAPGYTCVTGSTVTCTRAVLPPSPTADTFTLVVRVNRPTAPGTAIANTATATTTTPDPAANNSATAPAITVAEANIPTLSEWMLLLLAAMLAVIAMKMAK